LPLCLGIDVGAVSVKVVVLGEAAERQALNQAARHLPSFRLVHLPGGEPALLSDYRRVKGEPLEATRVLLMELLREIPAAEFAATRIVGSGGRMIAERLDLPRENEYRALAAGAALLAPTSRTVFEMGGETAKVVLLDASGEIRDYGSSGDCAAGTGSFLDQQATRLSFSIEEVGERAGEAERAARIAGRCSVFAKSDMIHAQQKGYSPEEILRGLCDAVSRNFKGNIARGKAVTPPVLFVGGVAQNEAVRRSLAEVFELDPADLVVPVEGPWTGALGAARLGARAAAESDAPQAKLNPARLDGGNGKGQGLSAHAPLDLGDVELLRHRSQPRSPASLRPGEPIYLGIDVGSVSTNLVVLDAQGEMVHEIYVRTRGRPVEVVGEGLAEIRDLLPAGVQVRGVGTTGSGRELIGVLLGADTINDEITAHKTGAMHVARRLTDQDVDTIFEIGGQDSKFISLDDGVVTDFAMNEACAAGTGSFLEEQAERMGIAIKDQFAELALSSQAPLRLGERCTVFMERELNAQLHRGASLPDLCAGLSYSIVLNYLNRVVRGRRIGEVIYFQGGTAYNDAVAAAFAKVLGKRVIVPPHNGVLGAVGMALLAREKAQATGEISSFRGWEIERIDYTLRKFTCKACTNSCDMEEFTVDGVKTYWGDKCSERYRRRARVEREPVIPDLVKLKRLWLDTLYNERRSAGAALRVGVPRSIFYYDRFPFWAAWLDALGADVVLSEPTNKSISHVGQEVTVAEPCWPITVAHGHVARLAELDVDFILLPNVINAEGSPDQVESYLCPWNQTLPYMAKAADGLAAAAERMLIPRVRFRESREQVRKSLRDAAARLGARGKQADEAVDAGLAAQRAFEARMLEAGREAVAAVEAAGREAILLLGRPYNLYDDGVNIGIPGKLRDFYGVNVIPLDFLDLAGIGTADLHPNMYWNYGRRILAAARMSAAKPYLHIIYITNFKCGPDSFIKQYIKAASGRPFLTLQFDGHANDAGALTRCEAYLDSKGVLRWWSREAAASRAASA
jgi:predicted CoA-substrate-specific enzyme activase